MSRKTKFVQVLLPAWGRKPHTTLNVKQLTQHWNCKWKIWIVCQIKLCVICERSRMNVAWVVLSYNFMGWELERAAVVDMWLPLASVACRRRARIGKQKISCIATSMYFCRKVRIIHFENLAPYWDPRDSCAWPILSMI